ncbi:hypothetical protein TRSA_18180 [Treponema saccharophilum]|uniref:Uncharacterized protein n=1 Tax=Treponema saccharophilum DSM 2985 TaxID=907348 RepID=H7EJN7_9SPIR|nr:hypothetical protein TresaDRAFT_2137 [Treponema saccharophilum DSM 2985]BDC96719.1 hypothetical protein TRSA_18180 [Treponema saccharophilum]
MAFFSILQTVHKKSPIIHQLNLIKEEINCFIMMVRIELIICVCYLSRLLSLQTDKSVISEIDMAHKGFVINFT